MRGCLVVLLFLVGCGGGGSVSFGGGGAALVSITANPKKIDIQDRTMVRIKLKEVNRNGIAVKIRFSNKLEYAPNTTFLRVLGEDKKFEPDFNVRDGNVRYLVYFIERSNFGDLPEEDDLETTSEEGELRLELTGRERIQNSTIEVDVDVDDPLIPNDQEFSVEEPGFQAEAEASISVAS
jgi:hypothetical protein